MGERNWKQTSNNNIKPNTQKPSKMRLEFLVELYFELSSVLWSRLQLYKHLIFLFFLGILLAFRTKNSICALNRYIAWQLVFIFIILYVIHILFTGHYFNYTLNSKLLTSSGAFLWYTSLWYLSSSQTFCICNFALREDNTINLIWHIKSLIPEYSSAY